MTTLLIIKTIVFSISAWFTTSYFAEAVEALLNKESRAGVSGILGTVSWTIFYVLTNL